MPLKAYDQGYRDALIGRPPQASTFRTEAVRACYEVGYEDGLAVLALRIGA